MISTVGPTIQCPKMRFSCYPFLLHFLVRLKMEKQQEILRTLPGARAALLAWAASAFTVLSCDGRHLAEMVLQDGRLLTDRPVQTGGLSASESEPTSLSRKL